MVKFSRSLLPAYVYVYILRVCEQERERVLEREPVCVRVPVCVCDVSATLLSLPQQSE